MPNDLDPERFTLRQAAQARDDFAMIMDELEILKGVQLSFRRAPTLFGSIGALGGAPATRLGARDRERIKSAFP